MGRRIHIKSSKGGVGKNVANANNFGGTGGTLETERLGSAIKHMVAVARSILFFCCVAAHYTE